MKLGSSLCYHTISECTCFCVCICLIFRFAYLAYYCFCAMLFSVSHSSIVNIFCGLCYMLGVCVICLVKQTLGTSSKRCSLCWNEKLKIALHRYKNMVKKRTEILNKCRHKNKYALTSYDSKDQSRVSFKSFHEKLHAKLLFPGIWLVSLSRQLTRLLDTLIFRESILLKL